MCRSDNSHGDEEVELVFCAFYRLSGCASWDKDELEEDMDGRDGELETREQGVDDGTEVVVRRLVVLDEARSELASDHATHPSFSPLYARSSSTLILQSLPVTTSAVAAVISHDHISQTL